MEGLFPSSRRQPLHSRKPQLGIAPRGASTPPLEPSHHWASTPPLNASPTTRRLWAPSSRQKPPPKGLHQEATAITRSPRESNSSWQTYRMDFFQKLFGHKEPTLILAESENWTSLPWTEKLQKALDKRAKKEKWAEALGQTHEFVCLLIVHGNFSNGTLEVNSLGSPIAMLPHELVDDLLERMRADSGLRMTAVKARATRHEDGRLAVEVNV